MESVTQSLANNGRSNRLSLYIIDLCRLLASSIVSAGWDSKSRSDFVDCRSQSGDEEIFWSLALSLSSFNLSLARARALSLSRARALPHNSAGVTNLLRGSSRWSKAVSKETYNVSKETYGKRLLETWSGTVVQMPDWMTIWKTFMYLVNTQTSWTDVYIRRHFRQGEVAFEDPHI
jgi:hypothetical protein